MAEPSRIGRWTIVERLGSGGNALVYRANDGDQEVALKVLRNKRVDSEPYARFRNEIELVRQFEGDQGVLPILEYSLPERPSRDDRAWIAMPIATPIRHALTEATFRQVISSVAEVGETLARVASAGVAHRDVKPDNLYVFDDRPAVSDFGIAHVPNPQGLRLTGSRLGPFGFTPDELIEDPHAADPFPVDVFQLAKTLLVLVSGAPYPPQGHIGAGSSGALSRYVAESRSDELDSLIDRSTRREPAMRPTMESLSRELRVWLEDVPVAEERDLGNLLAQFRHAHQGPFDQQAQLDAWIEKFHATVEEAMEATLAWVYQTLERAGLRPEISVFHDHHAWVERTRFMGMHGEAASNQGWVLAEFGNAYFPTKIAVGVGFDLDLKGEFWCCGHCACGDMESTATRQVQLEEKTAPIESLEVRRLVTELDGEIKDACVAMLQETSRVPEN